MNDAQPKNLKILMADDEPDVLEIMSRKIAAEGFDVITAQDGEEAWERIQKEAPDMILLDLTMPKKNGFEVLRDVRQDSNAGKWRPVIIVSAQNDLDAMRQGYELEADHYITKPCRIEDIIKAIRLMMGLMNQRKSRADAKK